jgi:antitoxin MazE
MPPLLNEAISSATGGQMNASALFEIIRRSGMKATIRKMGDSQGIIIPKPLLAQVGIEEEADLSVENGAIILRKPRKAVREHWAEASRELAEAGDDALVWPEFANKSDEQLTW